MTSSFMIKERMKRPEIWALPYGKFDESESVYHGQDLHYLRPFGNCHPDFEEIPIGNPYGVKVCVRKNIKKEREFMENVKEEQKTLQGYHRGSADLYDVTAEQPRQVSNPQAFCDRRIPNEKFLVKGDYLKWEVKYNTTGLESLHFPQPYLNGNEGPQDFRKQGPFYKYAYDMSNTIPPVKYDVTRLHQPYPIWKEEQQVFNRNKDSYDTTYFDRIV